ncbi:hypothetical protein [Acinetobacter piscicola]|uniref:Uncharacterized protein n=1 Tax=Acinetobacter piscicola TaxID=2006115 RepID=A0A7S6VW82_9GAMM|nr:hypothetical protein [Acinetobacter piscicola]QOW46068.1 hypothetical protein G0028_09265 [Acinetobacter piscicola]
MSDYTPPDALNVTLNFTQELKPIDSHNLVLNFGAEDGFNYANISIDTSFRFRAIGIVEPPIDVHGSANIHIDTSFAFDAVGTFDINHIVGVTLNSDLGFQSAFTNLSAVRASWSKPIFRAQNSAFYFEQAQSLSRYISNQYERTRVLQRDIQAVFEESTGLNTAKSVSWDHAEKCVIARNVLFDESKKLRVQRDNHWDELVRKRKQFTFSHEVAHIFEKRIGFSWDKGLELITKSDIPWQQAHSIYYRKHPVLPWPQPEIPQYSGSTDLNFICLLHEVDSHNVVLNFGDEDCIPRLAPRNWWYIVNKVEVSRLDNGEQIKVIDGSYNTSRSQWCWSYNLTVPASEIAKLEPINAQPVILKIQVNDNIHHMLLENRSRSRRFAEDVWTLTGRSQTALLDAPYSPTRSFLQENERTSVQLVQAELDRVNSDTQLNWQLIDELGWIVPTNSLSYANQTPITIIKQIAEAGGGFVYSEKGSNTLSIRPKYKKTFWDAMQFDDYDRLLPESLVTSQSTDYEPYPDYNGVTLTNDRTGFTGQVKRTGTAGDVLQETVSNPLFTAVSMGSYGKALLAKAGMIETHSLEIPIQKDVGECEPGDVIAFNAEWWGIVESVSVSFTHAIVNQNLTVERVLNE